LYGDDGALKLQWVKTKLDDERVDALFRESLSVLSQSVKGLSKLTKPPAKCMDDLLAVYPLGDPHSIWALAFTISAYFENEPRVTVDLSPSLFWFYTFGKVLICATHGDTVKPEQLLGVMATDRAEDWGSTLHRYFYTGHIHTSNKKEFSGLTWESFRTLAAKDAWAAGRGYRAGRDMLCIVHHLEHGEIERHRVDIGMIA